MLRVEDNIWILEVVYIVMKWEEAKVVCPDYYFLSLTEIWTVSFLNAGKVFGDIH